ncbi:MAG: filamentous hemagglutinin N-terminal domain-containing protein, partial [Polaromonas sp.]|nr:filamentous hemagglutinin N-terminal domain-containing protein [Polaromonas sp.]
MNRIYRLVWNQVALTWVAVAECARGKGKTTTSKLVAAATLSLTAVAAIAGPAGGKVTAGSGVIFQDGVNTTIKQNSQNLAVNWSSFNVGAKEAVNFIQPSASAIAVNRIFDTNGSQIMGRISANGQVYLINPNGILFGQGSQINVGGLVASTLNVTDASLTTASRAFSGAGPGSVVNQGSMTASEGGYVAMLGNTVINQGSIVAPLGMVAMGGGSATTLTFQGNGLVGMHIDQSVLNTLVANGGLIQADGGSVLMSAG